MSDKQLISNLQLQKILYFIQRHFLQNKKRALFADNIEAWQFDPVVRDIYNRYCVFGANDIYDICDININLTDDEKYYQQDCGRKTHYFSFAVDSGNAQNKQRLGYGI